MATTKKPDTRFVIKDIPAKQFQKLLDKLYACGDAKKFAKGKSLAQAWRYCQYGSWMEWLLYNIHLRGHRYSKTANKRFGTIERYMNLRDAQPDYFEYDNYADRGRARAKYWRSKYVVK